MHAPVACDGQGSDNPKHMQSLTSDGFEASHLAVVGRGNPVHAAVPQRDFGALTGSAASRPAPHPRQTLDVQKSTAIEPTKVRGAPTCATMFPRLVPLMLLGATVDQ